MSQQSTAQLAQVLFEIGKSIGAHGTLPEVLSRIAKLLCQLVDADACSIMLLDAKKRELIGRAAYGLGRKQTESLRFDVGQGVAGWVVKHGEGVLLENAPDDDRYIPLKSDYHEQQHCSFACVPLTAQGVPAGVITCTAQRTGAFDEPVMDILGFVAQTISLDLENMRLRRLAVTDPLTQAYNREFLQQYLPDAVKRASHGGQALSIAMVDIDHFKSVNDDHGHAVGDHVLAEVARRLRAAIRNGDFLIRYGGEEFLILLPGASAEITLAIAERMREEMKATPLHVGEVELEMSMSIGVAEFKSSDESAEALIKRADKALYLAKNLGRNRVEHAQ